MLGGLAVLAAAAGLIGITWIGATRSIHAQRTEVSARVTARITNQALTFAEQINRQILVLDQGLGILVSAWEADPARFDLGAWRTQVVALSGISRDMLLVDANGVVRQSSVPEAVGQVVADRDFFRAPSGPGAEPGGLRRDGSGRNQLFLGAATIDPIMRLWHMNAARALHDPAGAFAGAIVTDYRVSALTDIFNQTDMGRGGLVTLIGLTDGRLRAAVGPATIDPDASIAGSPMFAALRRATDGVWVGPSASDSVQRIHAFRHLPGRDLAIVVAMNEQEAMRPAEAWRLQTNLAASAITLLLLGLAGLVLRGLRQAGRREAALTEDRAVLAAANAQLEVARAQAAAKTEQLEATLAGMTDGVAMVDGHLCLVEWNARFPEIAGIPPGLLRVGLPMEEMLRAQAKAGQFGPVDVEAEVERRVALLRARRFGVSQRQRPDGRTLELRRNLLPDGGFVTLYSDITEHKRAEDALREARAMADAANAAKSRFVAIVSHEIRTPLNALLNTLRLLADSEMAPAQQTLLDMARQSGDALFGLINDILEMSRMEAGQLTLRPSLFGLRGLLDGSAEMFRALAAERGITLRVVAAGDLPAEMFADPGRLRQVLLNLLSNAVKFAAPGEVRLVAERAAAAPDRLRIGVLDRGPVIAAQDRARLFHPFSRLDRPEADDPIGTGLGLAICRHLATLMDGEITCDPWQAEDGQPGNAFWITLPLSPLPASPAASEATPAPAPHRPLPRTRILLVEDIPVNQLVTATLLRREGHAVDIAGSGAAAIQALRRAPYDLVFMDIFMPGMSGPEAAQRIRDLPGPAGKVPIIALTANVSATDAALFQDSGMNGVLGKPVVLSELLGALSRHVWAGHPAGMKPERPAPAPRADARDACPVLAADRISELRGNLPPATFASLIEECLLDLDHRLPALRRALLSRSRGAITAQAHAMVGMAAGYGMAALEARLRAIMASARDGETDGLGSATVTEVEAELARAAMALRETVQKEMA